MDFLQLTFFVRKMAKLNQNHQFPYNEFEFRYSTVPLRLNQGHFMQQMTTFQNSLVDTFHAVMTNFIFCIQLVLLWAFQRGM